MPLLLIIPLLITGFLVLSGCITVLNAATPAFVERARLDEPVHIASLDLFIAQADNHVDLFTRFSLSLSIKITFRNHHYQHQTFWTHQQELQRQQR